VKLDIIAHQIYYCRKNAQMAFIVQKIQRNLFHVHMKDPSARICPHLLMTVKVNLKLKTDLKSEKTNLKNKNV
jgi:hypothetical protein